MKVARGIEDTYDIDVDIFWGEHPSHTGFKTVTIRVAEGENHIASVEVHPEDLADAIDGLEGFKVEYRSLKSPLPTGLGAVILVRDFGYLVLGQNGLWNAGDGSTFSDYEVYLLGPFGVIRQGLVSW